MISSKNVSESDCDLQLPTTGNRDSDHQTRKYLCLRNRNKQSRNSDENSTFSTTKSSVKLSAGDCDYDGQLEISAKATPFLVVGHCRNCLDRLLSSSLCSSWTFDPLYHSYRDISIKCFRFWWPLLFPAVGRINPDTLSSIAMIESNTRYLPSKFRS